MTRVRIINEQDIDPRLDAEIRRGLVLCFPNDASHFRTTRAWHGSLPAFSVLLEDAGVVIAHLGVVDRVIRVEVQCGTGVPPADLQCGTGVPPVNLEGGTGVSPVAAGVPASRPVYIRAAGVQNVCVLPDHRGRGYMDRVLDAAMAEARRRGFDHGLLFCVPELEKVYARCGWRTLPDVSVTRIDDSGNETGLPGRNIAMYHPLVRHAFPRGLIHLQGNDW